MTVEQATVTDKRENIIFYIMFYTRIYNLHGWLAGIRRELEMRLMR